MIFEANNTLLPTRITFFFFGLIGGLPKLVLSLCRPRKLRALTTLTASLRTVSLAIVDVESGGRPLHG